MTDSTDTRPNQLSLALDDAIIGAFEAIGDDSAILRGRAITVEDGLLRAVRLIEQQAPPRQMTTPGGGRMTALMSSCGVAGWTSDESGYAYRRRDPQSGSAWPALPGVLLDFAGECASEAGFHGFRPNSCLINRYAVGAGMGLHQDRNEGDFGHPIVSVSLGLPATFLFGGAHRTDPVAKARLVHGDVVVFGGRERLFFHGVRPVADGYHELLGPFRINLTFRKVAEHALR